jgi:hypothetical protein
VTEQGSPAPEISPEIMAAVAAAMAAQKPAEPPAPNGFRLGGQRLPSNVINLDEQLAAIDTDPQPILLNGHTYLVRRDFTAPEANRLVNTAAEADQSAEASVAWWTNLVGAQDAVRLTEYIETLPMAKANAVVTQFGVAAGLGQAMGALGEA